MCDLFLVLAQAPGGLSCFLVPRVLPDGTRNTFRIQRLKDKLGNRSNASSEPEFDHTVAWLVGAEGKGVRNHVRHRSAFGRQLIDQPLMRNVLADLAVESEAATALTLRLAGATDRAINGDAGEHAFRRIALAIGKYWVTKRGPGFAAEALECFGGNGYVEESGMPRWYREAPLASIWEGSGNVNALDVLRALQREPETGQALLAELAAARGANQYLDAAVSRLGGELVSSSTPEHGARYVVEQLAITLQGSLLARYSSPAVADAFCASRLGGEGGLAYGTLPAAADLNAILRRALDPTH